MSVSDEMIEWARDLCGYGCGCDDDATEGCPNWEGGRCMYQAQMIAKALEAARAEGVRECLRMVREPTQSMLEAAAGALKSHIDALLVEVRARSKEKGGIIFVGPLEKHGVRWRAMVDARLSEMDRQPVDEGNGK